MDQIYQLQQQIQRLRQEINNISQVCSTMEQSEHANALQLQQMQQKEVMATQGLRRIQQAANSLNQELNQINNVAQQMISQMQTQRGFTTNISGYGTGISPYSTTFTTGQTGFNQPGTSQFGAGFTGTSQFGYAGQQGAFSGITANQNSTPAQTFSQITSLPYNMNAFVNELHPYRSQGFNQGQMNQFGGSTQAFSGLGFGSQNLGAQSNLAGNQNASLLTATNPLSFMSSTGTALQSYSPYQANQFGFR